MKKLRSLLMILAASAFIAACVKQDFDRPPITTIPVGDVYTIGDLVNILNTTGATQFNNNASVYGIVTMDEVSGNIYKSAYIQDATGAINLRLQESGGLRVGDSIRVYLKGVILSEYNKLRQLSNVHNDSNIVILANRKFIEPEVVTIDQIKTGSYQCKLIKLENVQFIAGDTASTWADTDVTTNRTIEDCSGKSVIVRTSNFASFQGENLPNGKGSLVAIAGIFNTTPQLYVRSTTEVKMDSARCGSGGGGGGEAVDMVNENFSTAQDNSDINIPGWANIAEAGTRKWQGKIYQGDGYAQATGYNSNLPSMITWLVTPNVKMDQKKYLRFRTAKAYWEHGDDVPLTVMVSSNFDGVNVATASWTPIEAKVVGRADADNTWVPSGDIDLSAFIPDGKIAVAFKYTGSGTKSTSIRIDDVYIGTQAGGGGGGGGTALFSETFSSNLGTFSQYSVEGNQVWGWGNFDGGCAVMTGYVNPDRFPNDDWLISPAINLSAHTGAVLTIRQAANFVSSEWSFLQVLVSTDYSGSGNPATQGTWTEINVPNKPSGTDWAFVDSGDIDFSAYDGKPAVYVAFRYRSSSTIASTWEISKVEVK